MKTLMFRSLATAALIVMMPASVIVAQDPRQVVYSNEELDNLVAPIALYPDALLAQILVAATFPEQVEVAARWVREHGARGIDDQNWDISVKAVAHYPPVLNMLANQEDWSTALGQAYAAQSGEVMDAVQRLREMAREQGNLVSTQEHTVSYERDRIIIVPANPRVIYVPTYDPYEVYYRPVFGLGFRRGYFSFGIGFPIGSWLVYDVDWYGGAVYYDGWYGGGWRAYARPYIYMTPVYVHPRYRSINININIFNRHVNYVNLDRRYRNVHRNASWERHDRDWNRGGGRNGRNSDRGGRGGNGGGRANDDGNDNGRSGRGGGTNPDDRSGGRTATFDDYRPERKGSTTDAREANPPTTGGSGFGAFDKRREQQPPRVKVDNGGYGSTGIKERQGGARSRPPVYSAPSKPSRAEGSYSRPSMGAAQYSKPPKAAPSGGGGGARSSPSRPSSSGKSKPPGGGGGGGKGRSKQ